MYTEQELRNILLNAGYDPDKHTYDPVSQFVYPKTPEQPLAAPLPTQPTQATQDISGVQKQQTSALEAFGRSAEMAALPTASGLTGVLSLGAFGGAVAGPPGAVIGGLVGGFGGGALGNWAQNKFIRPMIPAEQQQHFQQLQQEHPVATALGEILPMLATGNPVRSVQSLAKIPQIARTLGKGATLLPSELNVLQNLALGAGVGTGVEGGRQLLEGQFDPLRLGTSVLGGLLSMEPNRFGKALGIPSTADIAVQERLAAAQKAGIRRPDIKGYLPEPTEESMGLPIRDAGPVQKGPFEMLAPKMGLPKGEHPLDTLIAQEEAKNVALKTEKLANLKKENDDLAGIKQELRDLGYEVRGQEAAKEQERQQIIDRLRQEQETLLSQRGFNLQYEPLIKRGEKVMKGEINLPNRNVRVSKERADITTLPHEGGHGFLNDLKNSRSTKDKRLYQRVMQAGETAKGLPENQELVQKMRDSGYSEEGINEELAIAQFGNKDVNYKDEGFVKDVMNTFKYKLGTSDDNVVLKHLNERYRFDAPYGTRKELLPQTGKAVIPNAQKEEGEKVLDKQQAGEEPPIANHPLVQEVLRAKGEDFVRLFQGKRLTEEAYKLGAEAAGNPEAIKWLKDKYNTVTRDLLQRLESGDPKHMEDAMMESTKGQVFREAYEYAEQSGSAANTRKQEDFGPEIEQKLTESAYEADKKRRQALRNAENYPNDDLTKAMVKDASEKSYTKTQELEAFTRPDTERQQEDNLTRRHEPLLFKSSIDKVRELGEHGEEVAPALENFFARFGQLRAPYRDVLYHDLQKVNLSKSEAKNVMDFLRAKFRGTGTEPELSAKEQSAVDLIQPVYRRIAEDRIEAGLLVETPEGNFRQGRVSDYYIPDMLSDESIQLFTKGVSTPEAQAAIEEWAHYVNQQSEGRVSLGEARKNILEYVRALGGDKGYSIEFGALRKVEGYGIPEQLREDNLNKVILKYGNRAARDMAYWMELQSKPRIAAILGLPKREGGITQLEGVPSLASAPAVKGALQFVHNDFPNIQKHPRIQALSRFVTSGLLGGATGIRNTVQLPSLIAPYIETNRDLQATFKGILNAAKDRRASLEAGARSGTMDFDRWYTLEAPDKFVEYLNKGSEILRKYQGRDLLEQIDRNFTFHIGREIAKQKILDNNTQWLEKFGSIAKNEDGTWNVDQIAKNFTDRVQGTYDARGLSAGLLDSPFAPFFSLSRWGIEKSNVIWKDVMLPAYRGENFKPLLVYTLGSILTGTAIRELNEMLTGKRDYTPSVKEAMASDKGKEYAIPAMINIMQQGAYMGFLSDALKAGSDLMQGERPRGPINFPLADFMGNNVALNLSDLVGAIKQGIDPVQAIGRFINETGKALSQNYRILANRADPEELARSNKFRDIRIFKRLEGEPQSFSFDRKNRIGETPEQEFRKERNLGEAAQQMPDLIKRAIESAEGNPYKIAQNLRSLKANSYQTVPSPENDPLEFGKFISWLSETQGADETSQRLADFFKQREVNKVKASMVPNL